MGVLGLSHNPTRSEVSWDKFFGDLSKKDGLLWGYGYSKQFHITWSGIAQGNKPRHAITENAKPWSFHPLRLFMNPESDKAKLATVRNLVTLVDGKKKELVSQSDYDVNHITSSFERIREHMTRNMSQSNAQELRNGFNAAIQNLQKEKLEYEAKFYAQGRTAGFKPGKASSPTSFYSDLSHTWWPLRFNERFQIIEPSEGQFEIHRMSKPWFFQKWVSFPTEITSLKFWEDMKPKPVLGAAKVATAQKLETMIARDRALLRHMNLNYKGMIENLQSIKGRITRNTNASEKEHIEKAFDGTIGELKKIKMLAQKDFNQSWEGYFWNGAMAAVGTVWGAFKEGIMGSFHALGAALRTK